MKSVLIASFDMEVGGVERSLISMLESFNYEAYQVDLMLYRHQGDFMKLLSDKHRLVKEIDEYTAFRKPISEIFREKKLALTVTRLLAKYQALLVSLKDKGKEIGYYQMQLMWKYSLPFLPKLDGDYDIAVSYLWPHYFVAEKVAASRKIAWIHTDFSTINTHIGMDLHMWNKFNYIAAVSHHCREAFLSKYPSLADKTVVIENIASPALIRKMANEYTEYLEFGDDCFNVLTVARLSHAKGIDNAVKALAILHGRGLKNIKWYVVGYGGDEEQIKELIRQNSLENSFILLGKKINPYPYIKKCDLYVQPSRYEGKAVTVTEAKILWKPVLITRYKTADSQVSDGFDGIITELSAEGIANGIERLYVNGDLRNRLIENCITIDFDNSSELEKLYVLFD